MTYQEKVNNYAAFEGVPADVRKRLEELKGFALVADQHQAEADGILLIEMLKDFPLRRDKANAIDESTFMSVQGDQVVFKVRLQHCATGIESVTLPMSSPVCGELATAVAKNLTSEMSIENARSLSLTQEWMERRRAIEERQMDFERAANEDGWKSLDSGLQAKLREQAAEQAKAHVAADLKALNDEVLQSMAKTFPAVYSAPGAPVGWKHSNWYAGKLADALQRMKALAFVTT